VFYQTTATSNALTAGQQGMIQGTAQRAAFVNLRNASGAEIGIAATPVQVSLANTAVNGTAISVNCTSGCAGGTASNASSGVATSSTNGTSNSWLYGFNGTTWDQLQVDGSKYLKVAVQTATPAGTNVIGKVSIDQTTPGTTNLVADGGIYNSTAPTLTNGQRTELQLDTKAALYVSPFAQASGKTAVTGTCTSTTNSSAFTPIPNRGINVTLSGTFVANEVLQRSFDGGTTWFPITIGGQSILYNTPVSELAWSEPESGVQIRLACTWTSGTVTYRISQ